MIQTWARRSLLLSAAVASVAQAQGGSATVVGVVRDTAGAGVPMVRLTLGGLIVTSDSAGRFELAGLPPGRTRLTARRLGFEPLDADVDLIAGRKDSLDLVLGMVPGRLPGITADAASIERLRLADFYRHREIGNGFFFNRKELEQKRAVRVSDVLRRLPGVRILPDRSGRSVLRMSRSSNCPPDFWIDGQRAPFLNVDDLPLRDIEALEVYRGASGIPPEFNNRLGNPACGAVVIWTRLPG